MKITTKDLKGAEARIEGWKRKFESYKERGSELVESVVGSMEVNGAAFLMGLATGKVSDQGKGIEFLGAPFELSGGLILNGVGLAATWFDMPVGRHACRLADGMTAGYFYASGLEAGTKWQAKANGQQQLPAGASAATSPP